ncbi:MAG: hypothetical protein R2685_08125 [Candidatus Nitrosocosmicus sp.]|nr:hypothetical protein [Candidatus Nitrosocosmicus sp.]
MVSPNEKQTIKESEELFIGLVGAVGTDLDLIIRHLKSILKSVNYESEVVTLSSLLEYFEDSDHIDINDEFKRINEFMTLGNELRKESNFKDLLTRLGIFQIRLIRKKLNGSEDKPLKKPLSS